MNPETWGRVKAIFHQVVELPISDRHHRLDELCDEDSTVRSEVERLLRGDGLASRMEAAADEWAKSLDETFIGRSLGPYRIERELGRGGMGVVYLAVRDDRHLHKRVAIKLVKRGFDTDEVLRRFEQERRILGRLEHSNIAQIFDAGVSREGRPYFVMERVEGQPLGVYAENLGLTARLDLFRQICGAVQHAHRNLVVHRDLKPSNVLVTADGVPKLLDFGIAKVLDPADGDPGSPRTLARQRRFTPEYASPEQVRGEGVSTSSDIYSLGVLLYELLTGQRPYRIEERSPDHIERLVSDIDPPPPSKRAGKESARRLSGDLDAIVLTAMAKDPERRYATVDQLSEDIRRYCDGLPVSARNAGWRYLAGKFLRRHKVAATFLLLSGIFTASLLVLSLRLSHSLAETQASLALADREERKAREANSLLVELIRNANPRGPGGKAVTLEKVFDDAARRIAAGEGSEPEVQAARLGAVGRVYIDLGLYEDAAPLLERALELRLDAFGERHAETASSLDHLGLLRRKLGDPSAEDFIQRGLATRRALLQPTHPDLAESLTNLGLLKQSQRDRRADGLLREALGIRTSRFGADHPLVAESLTNLAVLELVQERYHEAIPRLERAIVIYEESFGETHPNLGASLQNLGMAYYRLGEATTGLPYFERALGLMRRHLGASHPDVLKTQRNLAGMMWDRGEVEVAEQLLRQVVALRTESLGDQHPLVASDLHLLGTVLRSAGRLDEAETYMRDAFDRRRGIDPPRPREFSSSLVGLGALWVDQGRPEEAESLLREGLDWRRRETPPDPVRIAQAEIELGACLVDLGLDQEAEGLLAASYPIIVKRYGVDHRRARRARSYIETLCGKRGADSQGCLSVLLPSHPE